MTTNLELARIITLDAQADAHVEQAKAGVRPVTNFYAALVKSEQAQGMRKSCSL